MSNVNRGPSRRFNYISFCRAFCKQAALCPPIYRIQSKTCRKPCAPALIVRNRYFLYPISCSCLSLLILILLADGTIFCNSLSSLPKVLRQSRFKSQHAFMSQQLCTPGRSTCSSLVAVYCMSDTSNLDKHKNVCLKYPQVLNSRYVLCACMYVMQYNVM